MDNTRIGIVGLGYVGLPLAVEFGKKYDTVGYDVRTDRIDELRQGHDRTLETTDEELRSAAHLRYTSTLDDIRDRTVYIVTVPTPVGKAQRPDLTPLREASKALGSVLKPGDLVIYESTVYPGTTEEFCVPILEQISGLRFNRDFHCGYSPERINPGDATRRVSTIKKVTSGSTPEIAQAGRFDSTGRSSRRVRIPQAPSALPKPARSSRTYSATSTSPDQRTCPDLQQARHRHARGARGRGNEMEFPAVSSRGWSVATASASTLIT